MSCVSIRGTLICRLLSRQKPARVRERLEEWCQRADLSVAINVGMFQSDQKSNVGYLRHGTHLNNGRWNSYRSVLATRPKDPSLSAFVWRDLDQSNVTADLKGYEIVVQNLRLIAGKGKNVWSQSGKRWSEAAVAADADGHLLFLYLRAPYSMHDFNALLLKLPLNVSQAMHVEGGPEASLSIHTATVNLDLCGSYETGFRLDETNQEQWPIPNVLGVAREGAAGCAGAVISEFQDSDVTSSAEAARRARPSHRSNRSRSRQRNTSCRWASLTGTPRNARSLRMYSAPRRRSPPSGEHPSPDQRH